MRNNIKSCWVVVQEGLTGTENQCLGVAEALKIPYEIKRLKLKFPWNILSPYLGFEQAKTFSIPFLSPFPDLVIASGRQSIAAARYIKKQSKGKTVTVQIQDPKVSANNFDLVAVPNHDSLRGKNVIITDAAPNRLTPQILEAARNLFKDRYEKLTPPRIAVLIGGNSKTHKMTPDLTKKLAYQLASLEGSLMITASRRTGEENMAILKSALQGPKTDFWDGNGSNPYFGMLAWADYIIVTADSTSMLSDACTTGTPVYAVRMEGRSNKFERLYEHLIGKGVMRWFSGSLEKWNYIPLNDSGKIAAAIVEKLNQSLPDQPSTLKE